jgi:hypothetical protein
VQPFSLFIKIEGLFFELSSNGQQKTTMKGGKEMKTGLIVYVFGSEPQVWDSDAILTEIKQDTEADLVELMTENTGHHNVLDAWRTMLVKGMKRVTCISGEFTASGSLHLTGRELRLYE